jgi:hypothetical protein
MADINDKVIAKLLQMGWGKKFAPDAQIIELTRERNCFGMVGAGLLGPNQSHGKAKTGPI